MHRPRARTAYARWIGLDWREQLRRRWRGGLVGGALIGAMLAKSVLNQPASPTPCGVDLLVALLWLGVLYGVVLSHVVMHAAAVLHGPATSVQLPPHH